MEYTKGKWSVIYGVPVVAFFNDENEKEGIIARIETNISDAKLISAAPEMYEALKIAHKWLENILMKHGGKVLADTMPDENVGIIGLGQALTKAEGRK